jgi:protein KRI1
MSRETSKNVYIIIILKLNNVYFSKRPIKDEIFDSKVYKNKKTQLDLKKKILASFYNNEQAEDEEQEEEEGEGEEPAIEEASLNKIDTNNNEVVKKSSSKEKEKKEKKVKDTSDVIVAKETPQKSSSNSETQSDKSRDKNKKKHKKKNKNVLESLTDARLEAYGIDPKKFHKKVKYGDQFKKKSTQND